MLMLYSKCFLTVDFTRLLDSEYNIDGVHHPPSPLLGIIFSVDSAVSELHSAGRGFKMDCIGNFIGRSNNLVLYCKSNYTIKFHIHEQETPIFLLICIFFLSHSGLAATSVAEPHHFYAAPAPGKNFNAAPAALALAPTLLYSKAKLLK
jgi:hypothetical protein